MDARLHAIQVIRPARALWDRHPLRLALAVLLGLVWWWAALRVAVEPASAGPVEQGLAVGGWSLSLLPVHVARWRRRRTRSTAAVSVQDGSTAVAPLPTPRSPVPAPAGATTASRPRRSGAGSGR